MAAEGQIQDLELDASLHVEDADDFEESILGSGYETPDGFESFADDYDDEQDDRPKGAERAGIYLTALAALAVPSIIVLAFFLPPSNELSADAAAPSAETADAEAVDTETVDAEQDEIAAETSPDTDIEAEVESEIPLPVEEAEPEIEVEVQAAVEEAEPEIEVEVQAAVEEAEPEIEVEVLSTVEEREPVLAADIPDLAPGAIELTVYDATPMVDGQYQFALRLKSAEGTEEIDTSLFTVQVQNSADETASTNFEFVHETLPDGSSALATVQAEAVGESSQFVVVSIGDFEVGRVSVDLQ